MSGEKLNLACLLWPNDQPNDCIVEVELDIHKTVNVLKKMIKDEYSYRLHNVDACDLVPWMCSIPANDRLQETLKTIHFDAADTRLHRMPPLSKISQDFTTVPSPDTIHILVQVPLLENRAPRASLTDLLKERKQFSDMLPTKAPSIMGVPSEFSKQQQDDKQRVAWSRPPTADTTIPVTLLHPIFRQFIDNCNRQNHQPTEDDNKLVLELMGEMSNFYSKESLRAAVLRDILTRHGIPVETSTISTKGHDFSTDGAVTIKGHFVAIMEVKGEIGSKGAEPYLFPEFNFPSLLITVFGAQISFSGAVWTTRPHFQVLTPTLPLFCHSTDMAMRESLARHFGAFKAAILSLKQCYDALENPTFLQSLDPKFPDCHMYHHLDTNATVNFKYLRQIDENKLLFIGEDDNGKRICIKFVCRYSREVHEKFAKMGIAPMLRGFEDIGAGWKMVIMDALDEEYEPFNKTKMPLGADKHLRERLIELHRASFVHGDVRDANIMVRKDGKPGYMLVDFDWSGIIGQVYYPMNINKVDIRRPSDAFDGQLIKSEHDMAMFEDIFK